MIKINVRASKRERYNAYQRMWRHRHPRLDNAARGRLWKQEHPDYERNRYRRYRDFLKQYLSTHPCVDCGFSDVRALEFDHVRGTKGFTVTQHYDYSREKILAEIAKCEIRCSNCHRIRHYEG